MMYEKNYINIYSIHWKSELIPKSNRESKLEIYQKLVTRKNRGKFFKETTNSINRYIEPQTN